MIDDIIGILLALCVSGVYALGYFSGYVHGKNSIYRGSPNEPYRADEAGLVKQERTVADLLEKRRRRKALFDDQGKRIKR